MFALLLCSGHISIVKNVGYVLRYTCYIPGLTPGLGDLSVLSFINSPVDYSTYSRFSLESVQN